MYKQKLFQTVLVFLICGFSKSFSQITAVPSATGCAPFSVTFSGPSGASATSWTLGSGLGTSTLSSPNSLYTVPGTYNITYTAIVNGSPVSYNTQLVVNAGPSGNFSYSLPSSHCVPMTVNFTSGGGSPGSVFTWAFGDLSPLVTGGSVSHVYGSAGGFVPIVSIYDPVTTCTALATSSGGTIYVSNPPTPYIVSSNGYVGCAPPFTTNFNGSGSISGSPIPGGSLSFNWTFGGGSPPSSGASNPGPVSFGQGVHTITLSVTDNNQCSNTTTVSVSVINPSLTATIPSTVCISAPVPATIQTNQSTIYANIQNLGLSSFNVIPGGNYIKDTLCILNNSGTHTIVLSVQAGIGCPPVNVTKTVFVEKVAPNFTSTPPHSSCNQSMVVTYVNLSTNNTGSPMTFTWTATWPPNAYHNAVPTSTIINNMGNATFTLYEGSSANPYTTYQWYFTPNITLYAESTSPAHCVWDTVISIYDTLARPAAYFNVDKRTGCAPLAVTLRDSSFTLPWNYFTSYTWCPGAPGMPCVSGTVAPPGSSTGNAFIPIQTFTYTTPGVYYPYLTISTMAGCTDISFKDTIIVVNPPTVNATFPATACAGAPVTITMTGTGTPFPPASSGIDHWHVDTDLGFFSGCITDATPTFSFTHVGTHTVSVYASQAGCASTVTLVPTITIKGPVGKFQFETTCSGNKKSVNFDVLLQEASSAVLDFGDGIGNQLTITGNATANTPTLINHVYNSTGDYVVTLTSYNSNGCGPYTFTRTVKVREPSVNITWMGGQPFPTLPNPLSCVNDKYWFDATATEANISCSRGYVWSFQAPGSPGYTLHPLDLAIPSFSTIFGPVPPAPHYTSFVIVDKVALDTFRVAGIYTISLVVKDVNGCMASDTKLFRISDPAPIFSFVSNTVCLSNTVQIINTTQASQVPPDVITNYLWSFGDGTYSTSIDPYDSPNHQYFNAFSPFQVYHVTCSATNAPIGCTATTTHTVQINNPVTGFNSDNFFPCLPLNPPRPAVNFFANSGYATYSLSYGDPPGQWTQLSGNFNNVSHVYNTPGIYTPTLTIIDAAGCKATNSFQIKAIGQPTAVIKFPNDTNVFCKGEPYHILNNSLLNVTPINSHYWTLASDLGTTTSPLNSISSIVNTSQVYTVTLEVRADLMCPSTATALMYHYAPEATAIAVGNQTTICLGDPLKVSVVNANSDVYVWRWFFGDAVSQPLVYAAAPNGTANPTVSYPYTIFPTSSSNGIATVKLAYYAPPGNKCPATSEFQIRVIKVTADFENEKGVYKHCLNVSDSFSNTTIGQAGQNFESNWTFGDGSMPLSQVNPAVHMYTQAGTFSVTLIVIDKDYGCVGISTKQMTVFPSPKANISVSPTLACPGSTFLINGGGTPGVSGTLMGILTSAVGNQTLNLAPSNNFSVIDSASASSLYTFKVIDNNSCESESVSDDISIVEPAPTIHWDTTVIIGQVTPLNAFVGNGFTYTWSPVVTDLSCDSCLLPNPVSNTTVNITYTVMVEDTMRCFIVKNTYRIFVDPRVSVDVPTAFTPNGDGLNDIIYPGGWGIRKLNFFKIFNRWGQLVFESNDLSVGWNGVYNGVQQNMETYVYQVSVETFLSSEPTLTKTGTFKLIR